MRLLLEECQKIMDECKRLPKDIALNTFKEKIYIFSSSRNIDPDELFMLYFNWVKKGRKD